MLLVVTSNRNKYTYAYFLKVSLYINCYVYQLKMLCLFQNKNIKISKKLCLISKLCEKNIRISKMLCF